MGCDRAEHAWRREVAILDVDVQRSAAHIQRDLATIIRNVTGDAYSWTVSAPGSGSQRFQFFGYPGRTFNAPLELENTGSGSVNLSLECIASDESCDGVELSTDHVQFDASSFTETTVMVQG